MAENSGTANYADILQQALMGYYEWLERAQIAKLKDELRIFQISYSVLYNMFLKKKLIHEDPYKQETKISEIAVPETGSFNEGKRLEQISLRLANYDNQLDFLVNFYQFAVDYMNLERIRKIVGLVRYIDWVNLTPDSQAPNTKYFAELVNNAKSGGDSLSLSIIGESITKLPKCTATIMAVLRSLSTYHKETYKLNVRKAITGLSAAEANAANIKKRMTAAMPGSPFFQEFIEEVVKEDYSKDGSSLREAVLRSLQVAEEKPKAVKAKILYKDILISGLHAVGASASVLGEVAVKLDENQEVLQNRKKGLWEKIRHLLRTMTSSEPEEVVYELQFFDQAKGIETKEHLNFNQYRADLDKKIKIYSKMGAQGPQTARFKEMPEEQLLGYLERSVKDLQSNHRILTALDEYFKSSVPREERDQIKGIKPDLAAVKNCFVKANQIRHDYTAQKEEEEQMKRMGINPNS
ncbi:MAG: hypothetical protein LBG95_08910 [Treponema sp.]|jgi:hypothetical protein|nr:hypothetical protein [Treponema sp.]